MLIDTVDGDQLNSLNDTVKAFIAAADDEKITEDILF